MIGGWRTRSRAGLWPGLALALSQLALMGTNVVFSLSLGYAAGLAAVGATASAVLVFQVTCGVVQRSLAEATLLADSHVEQRADLRRCQWSVAAALAGGLVGAVVAVGSTFAVPGVSPRFAVAYAAGIPFALALDIGRSADVAQGRPKLAFGEAGAWLAVQAASMCVSAAMGSPLGVCLSWAVVNLAFFLGAMLRSGRRPVVRGLGAWLRSRRVLMGSASLDALLVGLTPLLTLQVAATVATVATLGAVRVLQQLLAPLSFLAITLRRVLIYRRRSDAVTTARQDFWDGVLAMALMAVGGGLLAAVVALSGRYVSGLAFIPVGAVLLAAVVEKVALGFSYGCSLSKFIRGEFPVLLRARWVTLLLALVLVPLGTHWWGAVGYLLGSSVSMIAYSLVVLAVPSTSRAAPVPAGAPARQ